MYNSLEIALETYDFNNLVIDSIMEEFNMMPAFEAADTATTTNTSTTSTTTNQASTPNSVSGNNTQAANDANNDKAKVNDAAAKQKQTEFTEKIKKLFAAIGEFITKAIATFKGKLAYALNGSKNFDKEIREMEKDHKPRFDLVKKNRIYDFTILPNTIRVTKTVISNYSRELTAVGNNYSKVLNGSMNAEQFKGTIEKSQSLDYMSNPSKAIAKDLGPEFQKVETFAQLTKGIQQKHRGQQINVGAADNGDKPAANAKGSGSVDVKLDAALYSRCRQFLSGYTARMNELHQLLESTATAQKSASSSFNITSSGSSDGDIRALAPALTKMSKGLSTFTSLINFITACTVEQATNCQLVVKACLGG